MSPPIMLWWELGLNYDNKDAIDLIDPKDKKEKLVEDIPPEGQEPGGAYIASRSEWFVNEN